MLLFYEINKRTPIPHPPPPKKNNKSQIYIKIGMGGVGICADSREYGRTRVKRKDTLMVTELHVWFHLNEEK